MGNVVSYYPLSSEQRHKVESLMGVEVQIDSAGNRGKITSVSVTSDGFIIVRTTPGYDRGVFMGQVPHN